MPNQVVRGEIEIVARPSSVFDALTDVAQLTYWFCEHAEVSLDEGRYECWGRFTPDGMERSAKRISLTSAVSAERLSFDWSLYGCETSVRYTLRERAGGTLLAVEHTGLTFQRAWLLEVFWSMALENLRAWLECGEAGLRHDFTETYHGEVRHELEIDADAEIVFAALTEPRQLARYMADDPVFESEAGGRIDFGWGDDGPCRILELRPPQRPGYAWRNSDGGPDSIVVWQLEGSTGRTRLTLVHSGFAADRDTTGYTLGWLDYLNRLRFMCEVGAHWRKPGIELVILDEVAVTANSTGVSGGGC